MKEQYKLFNENYEVSNIGNIRNFKTKKLIKPFINNSGYYEIKLSINNKKKHFRVHRLVATLFIPNPCNYPIINHIDCNKLNNNVGNLEWCSYKYNNNYKPKKYRKVGKCVKINQYDKKMNLLQTFNSMKDVEKKYNISRTSIRYCCLGKNKTCCGYIWRYVDE